MKPKLYELALNTDTRHLFEEWIKNPVTITFIEDINALKKENMELYLNANLFTDKGIKNAQENHLAYKTCNTILDDIIKQSMEIYNGNVEVEVEDQNPEDSEDDS